MKITFADSAKADIVAFIVNEDGGLPEAATALDKETDGLLSEALSGGRFTGKKDQQALIVLPKGADFRRAVLIGGVAIHGGRGSPFQAVLGALVLSAINTVLVLRGISHDYQHLFTGILVLAAIVLNAKAHSK